MVALHARTGPYCGSCATGYFKKGKICAECDSNAKTLMYVEAAAQVEESDALLLLLLL